MSKKILIVLFCFPLRLFIFKIRKRIWKEGEKEKQIYCHKYHYSAMGK